MKANQSFRLIPQSMTFIHRLGEGLSIGLNPLWQGYTRNELLWLTSSTLRFLCVASLFAHLAILSNAKNAKMFAKDRKDELQSLELTG
jgi:hypothetical protein